MSPASNFVGIIPMKPISIGKSRLARALSPSERNGIVLGMLRRVILALQGGSVDPIWVVGGDDRVKSLSKNSGAFWREDPGRNLNDSLGKAFDEVFYQGRSAVYVPGDLPFIKPVDVHGLMGASRRLSNLTLSPARRDGGTNGIVVPRGLAFRPELGHRSFAKHLAQAARLEVSVAIFHSPGLGLDLDTLDDLEAYQHVEPGLIQRLCGFSDRAASTLPEGHKGRF